MQVSAVPVTRGPHREHMPRHPRRSYSTRLSRRLRSNMTEPEIRLWYVLRHDFTAKFHRQEPIGPYITGFCCHSRRVIVEVDGSQHAESASDIERDRYLNRMGFRVIRVWSGDVMTRLNDIVGHIEAVLQQRPNIHRRPG